MKKIMLLLFILTQVQVTSQVVLENELIGTWQIEKVHITRPGVCITDDINQIIGSIFTFTNNHLRYATSNNNWFSLDTNNQLYWVLENDYLVIKSKATKEIYSLKIIFKKDKLTLLISNLITIVLKKNLQKLTSS
ncbi:hypothetical protein PXD56_00700 [Maribacter sp. SA7]|uniref:hypothetical protein n=1 Tax=Maribacter zhoushanensis TaxID=3030012 RepID=UPI0023EABB58|nr:hypothetical protein [Maribacter zhoushanensis]MDF4201452.1 hypothetical protein [Maribacter zhoushanensis]